MTSSEKALIEHWIEIGKVRREVYDPAQGYRYFFLNNHIELELQVTWTHFFKLFNTYNHFYFCAGIEDAEFLLNDVNVTDKIIPFDPWENPHFISLEIKKMEFGGSNQVYQLIEIL